MTTRSTAEPRRRRHTWTEADRTRILRELDASGLSVTKFAARSGIHFTMLYAWRRERRLRELSMRSATAMLAQERTPASLTAFAPVTIVEDPVEVPPAPLGSASLELAHRSGWSLRVPADLAEAHVIRIVRALVSQC